MADQNPTTPISSFLCYPKFLNGLWNKSNSDTETTLPSPTSILDTKNSSIFQNSYKISPKSQSPNPQIPKSEPEAIGLALIDALNSEKSDENTSKTINRMVLFQSKLSAINPSSLFPADFGIKTRSSQMSSPVSEAPAKDLMRQLSLKEMEVCEDYTCVIIHGPNPKTTHIFDDCVVESSCEEEDKICNKKKKDSALGEDNGGHRDEKAFASHEMRMQRDAFSRNEKFRFG